MTLRFKANDIDISKSAKTKRGVLALCCAVILLVSVLFHRSELLLFRLSNHPIHEVENADLTAEQFRDEYLFKDKPFIYRRYLQRNPSLLDVNEWTITRLRQRFPDVRFRQGAAPYPIEEKLLGPADSLEVFQFGTLPATFAIGKESEGDCLPVFAIKYIHTHYLHDDPSVACALLEGVHVPPFVRKLAPLVPLGGLVVGGIGATTVAHRHEAALNILLHGEKHWILGTGDSPKEFIQYAGDIVFIPSNVEHEVKNVHPSVAWTFQFHENHFGTQAGLAETQRLIDNYFEKQSELPQNKHEKGELRDLSS